MTFVGRNFVGIIEALPALGALAEVSVNRLGVTGAAQGRSAEFAFPNGIADADVHARLLPTSKTS